jgi:spermidine synthase
MSQSTASCLKSCGLPLLVFFTGACVLVLEIVATRILSPYYGNTIFTVSSVITVVLAALSLGYYAGGRLADKKPEAGVFFTLILLSGLSVLLTYVLMVSVLQAHGFSFPIMTGPLVFSLILFLVPNILFGTLSPFAIKLQTKICPDRGTGRIAGEIFFWSTVGSIAGSILSGFFLIPHFGIKAIVVTTGVALTVLGLALLAVSGGYKKKAFSLVLLLTALVAVPAYSAVRASAISEFAIAYNGDLVKQKVMFSKDGVYEKVMVTYSPSFRGHRAHMLVLDRSYSGMMFLDTDEPAAPYYKYATTFGAFGPDPKNVLVLGGGAYAVPKQFLDVLPDVKVDVAEIEPVLFDLGKKYFDVDAEDPRLHNFVQDGRRVLHESDRAYDIIFSDVFNTLYSVPGHMATTEFFETAKSKLNAGGVFMANLAGNINPNPPSFLWSEIRTFCSVFPNCYLFQINPEKPDANQNFIMVGVKGDRKPDFSAPEIKNSKNETIRGLAAHSIDLAKKDLSPYTILTDDYVPVDSMTAAMLENDPDAWHVRR